MSRDDRDVLLVIDAQVAMFDEAEPPHRVAETIATIADLVQRARVADVTVIFVRHADAHHEPMQPGHPGFEVHPAFAPLPHETVIDKRACDSFSDTPLAHDLEQLGATRLIVTGMQSEMCVDTASRSALHRGYDVMLVADGHTTWDNDLLTAKQIIAHTNATLPKLPLPTATIVAGASAGITFAA